MQTTRLRATEQPERLVCQAARGDYYEGYVGDTEYETLMRPVEYDEEHIDRVCEIKDLPRATTPEKQLVLEAKTLAFVEAQLARGHYGPWEHPQVTLAIEGVSRVTMAQITRHRLLTFDIQSMRYADFSDADYVVPPVLLTADERAARYPHLYGEHADHFNRQDGLVQLDDGVRTAMRTVFEQQCERSFEQYQAAVESGVPKEDARFLLPLATPVNITFSGNARSLMHLFNLRQKASAQWEIRALCNEMAKHLKKWAPYTFTWYEQNKPHKIGP